MLMGIRAENKVGKGVKNKKSVAVFPRLFTRLVISGTIAGGSQEEISYDF